MSILWRGVGEQGHASELNALKAGDENAFSTLVQRYHGALIRLAMGYVRDHAIAEDVSGGAASGAPHSAAG